MTKRGFTLIELMVTIGIFTFMTALILARYNTFNSGTLLTNTAYDIALTIRQAQTYGISVLTTDPTIVNFNAPYGVVFVTSGGAITGCTGASSPTQSSFFMFNDVNVNGKYDCPADSVVSTYNLKQGAKISSVCGGTVNCSSTGALHITFKRPDPSAIINVNGTPYTYAEITVKSSDNSGSRKIVVRQNGQISVQ